MRIGAGRDHSQGVQPREPRLSAAPVPDLVAAYVEHARFVERVLRRAGVAERDVPDARQDVFVVAHRRLSTFEGRGRLSTWLYRIAWNVASEYRRRACHRREQLGALAGDGEGAREADGAQALRLEQRELLSHALSALEALDDDKREAFVLAELVGLSMREVAARVGCPLKTAFSRAYAARRRMLSALRERGVVLGLVPWFAPLRWQRLCSQTAHAAPAAGGSSLLAAQAQLALLSLACAALPGLSGSGVELGPHALGATVARPVVALAASAQPTAAIASVDASRAAALAPPGRTHWSRSRSVARPREPAREPVVAAALAPGAELAAELIVVHDGQGWLLPAVDHPLERAPALRPLLPPIALLRGPRSALGQLPATLPPEL